MRLQKPANECQVFFEEVSEIISSRKMDITNQAVDICVCQVGNASKELQKVQHVNGIDI